MILLDHEEALCEPGARKRRGRESLLMPIAQASYVEITAIWRREIVSGSFLIDTYLAAQDGFKEWADYFRIPIGS